MEFINQIHYYGLRYPYCPPRRDMMRPKPFVLPDNAVIRIFSYLSLEDKKSARLVCRRWSSALWVKPILQQVVLTIRSLEDLKRVVEYYYSFVNVKLILKGTCDRPTLLSVIDDIYWFTIYYGEDLKMLNLHLSDSYLDILPDFFNHCEFLEHFSITLDSKCETINKKAYKHAPRFRSLKILTARGDPNVLGEMLATIILCSPMLIKFGFSCGSSNCQESHEPLNFIRRPMTQSLKEIHVLCGHYEDTFFNIMENSQIERVSLKGVNLYGKSVSSLRRVINLKHLFLQQCMFNEGSLYSLLDFKQLTIVSLVGSMNLPSSLVTDLRDLPNLSHLDLSNCNVSYTVVLPQIFCIRRSKLVELNLAGAEDLNDHTIRQIAPNLRSLKVLNLSNCPNITNRTILILSLHNPYLQCLKIQRCPQMMGQEMIQCINRLILLQHLDIRHTAGALACYIQFLKLPYLRALEWDIIGWDKYIHCHAFLNYLQKQCQSLKYVSCIGRVSNNHKIKKEKRPYLECSHSPLISLPK